MQIFKFIIFLIFLSCIPNLRAFTTDITIDSIQCKGTIIRTKNTLALLTAGHCLKNYEKYAYVRQVYIKIGKYSVERKIKQVIYGSEKFKSKISYIPSNDDSYLVKAGWCSKNHKEDIALVILHKALNEHLISSVTLDKLNTAANLENPRVATFKFFEVQDLEFRDYTFTTSITSLEGIMNGNSGTPLYVDGKLAGVASCYIDDGLKKVNYFAAWSQRLQAYLK